jgi:hypothetical protein
LLLHTAFELLIFVLLGFRCRTATALLLLISGTFSASRSSRGAFLVPRYRRSLSVSVAGVALLAVTITVAVTIAVITAVVPLTIMVTVMSAVVM